MLKCKDIAHQASTYLDPTLPWHKKVAWHLHLSMCSNCRRFVNQFKLTLSYAKGLGQQPAEQTSAEEVERVMEKIKHQNK